MKFSVNAMKMTKEKKKERLNSIYTVLIESTDVIIISP